MSKYVPTFVQIGGAGALTAGIGLWNVPAALVVGGLIMTVFGVALERSRAE